MTALYMDGFDHYGTGIAGLARMLEGPWAQVAGDGGPGVPPYGAGTGELSLQGSIGGARLVLPATKTNLFLSLRFSVVTLPTFNGNIVIAEFDDATNTTLGKLVCQSTGAVALYDVNGDIIAQTVGPVITASTWHFLEMNINTSAGTFTLRIDDATASEAPAISATGLTFVNPVAQLQFVGGSGIGNPALNTFIDDLFIRDSAGSINNSWLGDRRVALLLVDQDTATAGWTANRYHEINAGILKITTNNACLGVTSASDLNIGASDFTLESFVRFNALPTGSNKSVIFSKWGITANQRSYQLFLGSQSLNGGSLCWQTSTDGTVGTVAQPIVYPFTPDLDTWYHIAIVRSGGQLLLFVNGEQLGLPISDASTYFAGTGPWSYGAECDINQGDVTANTTYLGWADETRFTNGVARYTANFTPTTVAFPRGVSDPDWADVSFLAGYDSIIQDESSAAHTINANGGAAQQTTNDSPDIGVWPVIGKSIPDDNTFISAPFVAATSILTLTVNASNTNTVTVGTTNGATPAVYTFKTALASAFDVLIDTNIQNTLQNLYNAINNGPGSGTKYHAGTTPNFDVIANQLPAGQMQVSALIAGTVGNSIATTSSGITGGWTSTTLIGGLNIPGPSAFKTQRLPSGTTIISAVQLNARAFKTDAGVGTIVSSFIGPLGGVATGDIHSLTTNPVYYKDIFEVDPDTSGPISPTTIIGGTVQIERDS